MKLEEHIDILKEYPFKVSYPRGGNLQLLVWYTDWDRHHVLAASSEDRIEHMLRAVLKKEGPGAKPVEYWKVEIVSPPLELRQTYARGRMLEDVDGFRWYVGCLFKQATEASKDDPKLHPYRQGARRCAQYRSRWGGDRGRDKDHSQCLNCFMGWLPPNHTVESLYLLRRHEPRHSRSDPPYRPDPNKRTGYPTFFESSAPPADPSRPLYALEQNFGNHSHGLEIKEVTKDKETGEYWYGPNCSVTPTTFFFHGEKLEMPSRFLTMAETAKADYEREEAAKKAAFEAKKRKEREEANETLRKLLRAP